MSRMLRGVLTACCALLLPAVSPCGDARPDRLSGCRDPKDTAELLRKLGSKPWSAWNAASVSDLWPDEIKVSERDEKQRVVGLTRRGRVINEMCECCESLGFDVKKQQTSLWYVSVFYSSGNFGDVVEAGKQLLEAISPPPTARVFGTQGWDAGPEASVRKGYRWSGGNGQPSVGIDLETSASNGLWTLHLYWGRGSTD